MKIKYYYLALTREQNGKYYSYILRVSTSDNIKSKLNAPDIVSANIYTTKKEATKTVNYWNACYKANGQYIYDEVVF